MTKQQFIEELANHNEVGSKAAANRILDGIKDIIKAELVAGNEVSLGTDFGTFKPTKRSGLAPTTGKPYSTNLVKFSISAPFKRALNQ